MPEFVPGLKLSEAFYHECVRPVLNARFAGLAHSAALIGPGSEVLGFDTPMSTDHHWGPRVMLFLREDEHARRADAVRDAMRHSLPHSCRGYPTNYTEPQEDGSRLLAPTQEGPVNHRVDVLALRGFFQDYLGWDPQSPLEPADWLTFPSQKLRTLVGGAVYHDDLGLGAIRVRLAWYPDDVRLYLLAAGWTRIGQEEPFVGRSGDVGDDLGSQVLAGRLARDVMRLCFLMEREYAPYPKWFGTAFSRLPCAPAFVPLLRGALLAETWREREGFLSRAYEALAERHNALGITPPLPAKVSPFHGRPFQVIHGDRIAAAIRQAIRDERVRRIRTDIGSVDQFSDSTDLLENVELCRGLRRLYE